MDPIVQEHLARIRQFANEARRMKRDRNVNEVIALAQHQPITNQLVREILNVSRASAALYLRMLTRNGELSRIGRGRSTAYLSSTT